MVSSLCQCLGNEGKVCSGFFPALGKDPHLVSTSCRGKGAISMIVAVIAMIGAMRCGIMLVLFVVN